MQLSTIALTSIFKWYNDIIVKISGSTPAHSRCGHWSGWHLKLSFSHALFHAEVFNTANQLGGWLSVPDDLITKQRRWDLLGLSVFCRLIRVFEVFSCCITVPNNKISQVPTHLSVLIDGETGLIVLLLRKFKGSSKIDRSHCRLLAVFAVTSPYL